MAVTQFILAFSLILTVLGAFLLWRGWLSRRRNVDPHCCNCGYNLRGRDRGRARCSECGADLSVPGSIELGRRQVRRQLVVRGLTCLALGVPTILAAMIVRVGQLDISPLLPTWSLLLDARGNDPSDAFAAWAELDRRFTNNLLTTQQIDQIVVAAAGTDANRPRQIDRARDRLIRNIWLAGTATPAAFQQYIESELKPRLVFVPAGNSPGPIGMRIACDPPPAVRDLASAIELRGVELAIGQKRFIVAPSPRSSTNRPPPRHQLAPILSSETNWHAQLAESASLAHGFHEVTATLTFELTLAKGAVVTAGTRCVELLEVRPPGDHTGTVAVAPLRRRDTKIFSGLIASGGVITSQIGDTVGDSLLSDAENVFGAAPPVAPVLPIDPAAPSSALHHSASLDEYSSTLLKLDASRRSLTISVKSGRTTREEPARVYLDAGPGDFLFLGQTEPTHGPVRTLEIADLTIAQLMALCRDSPHLVVDVGFKSPSVQNRGRPIRVELLVSGVLWSQMQALIHELEQDGPP